MTAQNATTPRRRPSRARAELAAQEPGTEAESAAEAVPEAGPAPEPEAPRWPAIGADAETLRSMPHVAYLWTEPVPSAAYDPVITAAMDRELREASAAMRDLRGACVAMAGEWEASAYAATFGPLDGWMARPAFPVPYGLVPFPEITA